MINVNILAVFVFCFISYLITLSLISDVPNYINYKQKYLGVHMFMFIIYIITCERMTEQSNHKNDNYDLFPFQNDYIYHLYNWFWFSYGTD